MKKKIIIISFITFLLGGILVLGCLYYYNPDIFNKSEQSTEKIVTITDNGIADAIEKVYDAVVVVENYKNSKLSSIGSGFIYSEEGYIMTNQHVIADSDEVKIQLSNGDTVSCTVIGGDEYADIAVVKIDSQYVTQVASIGNSEDARVGDTVFTIGSPMSSDYAGTVTRGILSGKNRMVEVSVSSSSNDWIMNVMQTDAAINPGNSGGPLCNVNGEVIGINSMKIAEDEIEGIGFAIPIEDAMEYANKIVNNEEITKSYLGISMAEITTTKYYLSKYNISIDSSITSGVIVLDVDKDSPADTYGIEKGDVIVKIGDNDVNNVAQLRYYLYKHSPNEEVSIKIIRGTEEKTFNVVLGKSD